MVLFFRLWYALSWRTRNILMWLLMFSLLGFFWYIRTPANIPDVMSSYRFRIIDGDTLVIRGERIRLRGIDAPEMRQFCQRPNQQRWPCGRAARRKLLRLTQGRKISCRTHGTDYYNRILATCRTEKNQTGKNKRSLNLLLVASGYAIARRASYRRAERHAKNSRLGIWNGSFTDPGRWRKLHLSQSATTGFWSRLWHRITGSP